MLLEAMQLSAYLHAWMHVCMPAYLLSLADIGTTYRNELIFYILIIIIIIFATINIFINEKYSTLITVIFISIYVWYFLITDCILSF